MYIYIYIYIYICTYYTKCITPKETSPTIPKDAIDGNVAYIVSKKVITFFTYCYFKETEEKTSIHCSRYKFARPAALAGLHAPSHLFVRDD